jgi:arylsulfatase A-like enzyme
MGHIKMRFLLICSWLMSLTLFAADRPNIIVILADDQGFGDLGANNPQSKIATPNLDALAKGGLRFTDGHTSSGVCTPTRYSLLTGRYHWRTKLQSGVLGGFSTPLIAKDRLTVAGLLKQQGYATGCFGKWHLGMSFPLKNGGVADDGGDFSKAFQDAASVDYGRDIVDGPVDHGFDTFYGISASLDMPPFVWIKDRRVTEIPSATKTWLRTGPAGPKFEAVDMLPSVIDHSIAFIETQKKADPTKPFFIYIPLNAPHTPIVPTKEFQGSSGISPYADFVKQVDHDVGRLLASLEKQGLTENTLVVFTADNGCSTAADIPELQKAGHEPSYIYRGNKADLYEGGHRVPFLVRWPAQVKPGVSNALVGQLDFLATFADITGASVPAAMAEDSVSFLPVLRGDKSEVRQGIVSQSINGSFAIRDGQWKLLLSAGSAGWSSPKPGPEEAGLPPVQLYDLSKDPGERKNLQAEFPERVAAMKAELEKIIARGRSTPGDDLKNDVEVQLIKKSPAGKAKAKKK